jgi:hypothetical protein
MDEKAQEILKSLAEDVAEAASYLRELGVEGLEGVSSFEAAPRVELPTTKTRATAPVSPALRRNASAERPPKPPPIKRTLPPPPPPRPKQAE